MTIPLLVASMIPHGMMTSGILTAAVLEGVLQLNDYHKHWISH
jgi:hypothetical protein